MRRRSLKTLAEQVAVPHTAILVIDMQNAFFAEESNLGDKAAKRTLIPRLQQFLEKARAKHVPLVFIRAVISDDDASVRRRTVGKGRRANSFRPGSPGGVFIPEIQPQPNDILIEKTKYNAFLNTPLDARLRNRGITTVIATGIYTNVCVGMTAYDASMRNYYVVVPDDLCVGTDEELHRSTLQNINRYFGTVTSSDELLQMWEAKVEAEKRVTVP